MLNHLITFFVSLQFFIPISLITLWEMPIITFVVLMPETSMNEDDSLS